MINETNMNEKLERLNSFLQDENIELVAKIEIKPLEDPVRNIYDEQAQVTASQKLENNA